MKFKFSFMNTMNEKLKHFIKNYIIFVIITTLIIIAVFQTNPHEGKPLYSGILFGAMFAFLPALVLQARDMRSDKIIVKIIRVAIIIFLYIIFLMSFTPLD